MIEHNGKKFARVSEVLSPFSSFEGISASVLESKSKLGTEVHAGISDDVDGDFPVLSKKAIPYYESFILWKLSTQARLEKSEERFFCNKLNITGQIDGIARLGFSPAPVLVDFKTSASENKVTWPMQAHLYYHLLKENGVHVGKVFLFVKLHPKSLFPTVYSYSFSPSIYQKCLDAVQDFWSKNSL